MSAGAYVVAGIELIGGIALIIRLGKRGFSALIGIMIGAAIKVKIAVALLGNGQLAAAS